MKSIHETLEAPVPSLGSVLVTPCSPALQLVQARMRGCGCGCTQEGVAACDKKNSNLNLNNATPLWAATLSCNSAWRFGWTSGPNSHRLLNLNLQSHRRGTFFEAPLLPNLSSNRRSLWAPPLRRTLPPSPPAAPVPAASPPRLPLQLRLRPPPSPPPSPRCGGAPQTRPR